MSAAPPARLAAGPLRLAAGMLLSAGRLDPALTLDDARRHLGELLDRSTLWRRTDDEPRSGPTPDPRQLGRAARWEVPDEAVVGALGPVLGRAWSEALAQSPRDPAILRLTVADAAAHDALDALAGDSPGLVVVGLQETSPLRFAWRWPLRIGVLDGPRAEAWRTAITASHHHGTLYDVDVVGPGAETDRDILVVDDQVEVGRERSALRAAQAACVIVVGDRPIEALLERATAELRPAIAAGVRADDVTWFPPLLDELSHDQPVDVALALSAPDARTAGDPELVTLTAVGRWAAAMAVEQADHQPLDEADDAVPRSLDLEGPAAVGAELTDIVSGRGDFSHESHAATEISMATRTLVGTADEMVFERRMAFAAAPPGHAEPPPPSAPARQLLADITRDGELCRRSLRPESAHQIEVQIAVPETPEEVDPDLALDEHAVPTGDGVARLSVVVTCPDLALRAEQTLDLPTADRSRPSTVAVFPFRTGAEGSTLAFEVLVLHQKRPIQAARLLATVRATPARRDRIQLVAVPMSSRPEPVPEATPADLALDARDGDITNINTGATVPAGIGEIKKLLTTIEQRASRVLAGDDATVWEVGEQAPKLLIELARLGSNLHRKLADVDDTDPRTVSLLVRYDTAIIPLELAYAGPAPRPTARLCAHALTPPSDDGRCTKASTAVVCPYAFWGMHRTIARTIERRPRRVKAPPPLGPLRLQPVLYAAADLADAELPNDTPPESRPSGLVESALRDAAGVEITRVTNWRRWRTGVRTVRPELLVVLAHTETIAGESTLLIGAQSVLAQPDVTMALVAAAGAPAPLVVLMACASGVAGDDFFGALPASFTDSGAAAVVATLSKLKGPDGARAAGAIVSALRAGGTPTGVTLGAALTAARRQLVTAGLLVGLVLVAHGEIDVMVMAD